MIFSGTGSRALPLAVLFAGIVSFSLPVVAQQKPSTAAIAMANEILAMKGATNYFQPIIPGVIEQDKNMLLQQNPMLQKDLNALALQLRTEFSSRISELMDGAARTYASHFTEAELKDILAFYKSPVGRKTIEEDPKTIDQSLKLAQEWSIKFSEEVLARMRAEMKKKGHDL